MHVRIDTGATFLALCACGWRGLPCTTHEEALIMARHHEQRAHEGDDAAAAALRAYRNRNR